MDLLAADVVRVNVGAGRHVLDGWINVDVQRSARAKRDPDIFSDARKIPLPDECANELMAIHLWEHFYPWECDALLAEWRRLLKPGGLLVLELPDLVKCCRNVIDGGLKGGKDPDQLGMWGLYGDPRERDPYMMHKWGWAASTVIQFLSARGFRKVVEKPTQWHPAGREHRDMRIEARKA